MAHNGVGSVGRSGERGAAARLRCGSPGLQRRFLVKGCMMIGSGWLLAVRIVSRFAVVALAAIVSVTATFFLVGRTSPPPPWGGDAWEVKQLPPTETRFRTWAGELLRSGFTRFGH